MNNKENEKEKHGKNDDKNPERIMSPGMEYLMNLENNKR
jgi:hypothetical protein